MALTTSSTSASVSFPIVCKNVLMSAENSLLGRMKLAGFFKVPLTNITGLQFNGVRVFVGNAGNLSKDCVVIFPIGDNQSRTSF